MKYRGWIAFSGLVWLVIGTMLLYKGLNFIGDGTVKANPELQKFATLLIGFGLLIGFLKGRFVLSKTVRRVVTRIISLPLPIRAKDVYPRSYYLLILGMMALGWGFRFLPIAVEWRGMIDVAIGSALINGGMLYLRAARFYDKSFLFQSQGPDKAAPRGSDGSSGE